ncbi:MAG: cytochrome c oxidase subunit 3, partial [Deltaproteobacteria bacterium]
MTSLSTAAANPAMEVLRYKPRQARNETTAWIGMLVFLGSWAMLFAGLFFAYGAIREATHAWPPKGLPALPLALPTLNTFVLAGSSVLLQLGVVRLRRGLPAALLFSLAALLGALFLALQLAVWIGLWRAGLRPTGGPFPSVFYGLTVFHALHVLVGLFALAGLAIGAASGRLSAARQLPARLWALYWHFVGAVWLVLFASVY